MEDDVSRDRPAVLIAMLLLALGVFGAALTTALIIRQHHKDVAALHRDPSYRYGNSLSVFAPPFTGDSSSPRDACTRYLAKHPASFRGFSVDTAVRGCIDEWKAATD